MSNSVNPIPEGYTGVVPHLIVKGAKKALAFYSQALGAKETSAMPIPGSDLLLHAEMEVGGNRFMLAEESVEWGTKGPKLLGGTPVVLHLYVEDVDAAIERAGEAGGEILMAPTDMFWGDRYAKFLDPFGHEWSLATHIHDPSPEEMAEAMEAWGAED